MYGLIEKIIASLGNRDQLIAILLEDTNDMPGCLSYVIAKDSEDVNALRITEVWETKDSHTESLSLPSVPAAISSGKQLIEGFGERYETSPVGGQGLS